jgi:hypothetical protein
MQLQEWLGPSHDGYNKCQPPKRPENKLNGAKTPGEDEGVAASSLQNAKSGKWACCP